MKKAFVLCISFVCAFVLCAIFAVSAASAGPGDVNCDGKYNARDTVIVMKAAISGFSPSGSFSFEAADMNGDGKINARDVILVMKEILLHSVNGPVLDTGVNNSAFSAAYNSFLSHNVFLGDSICKGLSAYGYLPADNVVAENSVATYNAFDFSFGVRGTSCGFADALKKLNPASVVVFLGMNDTWRKLDAFIADYAKLVDAVQDAVPKAKIYVASITPVSSGCTYTTNAIIDSFNAALKKYAAKNEFGFVDVSTVLKGSGNALSTVYKSSDGIHLPPSAYPVILKAAGRSIIG